MSSRAAVEARSLRKSYAGRAAVDGIDFEVPEGACFGFLGPNGAGKTTTMRMIYGLTNPDSGELEVLGEAVEGSRRTMKSRIGVVPQETNLDNELDLREGLLVQAGYFGIRGAEAKERTDELLDFALLGARAEAKPRELSGGMKRRLLISRALVARPELVVLDEPTTGLDPQARLAVWDSLETLRKQGVTLILTTHYMEEAERLCDALVIMDEGRIVASGSPAELIERHVGPEVLELRPAPDCDVEGLIASLEGPGVSASERSGESVIFFVDDAEKALARHDAARFPLDSALARRAGLEDVFLRLTGRSLRE